MHLPSLKFEVPCRPFARNWPLHILIAVLAAGWIVLFIHPVDWKEWLLENVLPVLLLILLAVTYRKFVFSNVSYLWLTVFLLLHLTGAHYAYKSVPIDYWYRQTFHTEHGVSDRIVHFAFGLLLVYPVQEVLVRVWKLRFFGSYLFAFAIILACSALFEIVEMLVGLLGNKVAETYMGLQGDPLDSQKDMVMTLIGSLLTLGGLLSYRHHKYKQQHTKTSAP